jgi:ribose/xylose/arabinose/galactoside ABC-type transport system permease subunit
MRLIEGLRSLGRGFLLRRSAVLLTVIFILGAAMTLGYPGIFFSSYNFSSILLNMSFDAMVVVGMTILLIGGEIDLSVGWNLSMSGIIYALLMTKLGLPIWLAIPVTLMVSAVCGLLIGLIVAKVGVNSFIATLAAGLIYYGIQFWLAGGQSVTHLGSEVTAIGMASMGGLQLPIWYAAAIVALFIYLMGRTKAFRQYYYIGLSKEVALHSGIPVARMKIIAFVLSSVLASFAGIISAARYANAILLVGQGMEMKAITAAMVGGVSFTGGIGTLPGAMLGLLFIALINNGMIIANVNNFWQPILIGGILLGAVILDVRLKGMGSSAGKRREGAGEAARPAGAVSKGGKGP